MIDARGRIGAGDAIARVFEERLGVAPGEAEFARQDQIGFALAEVLDDRPGGACQGRRAGPGRGQAGGRGFDLAVKMAADLAQGALFQRHVTGDREPDALGAFLARAREKQDHPVFIRFGRHAKFIAREAVFFPGRFQHAEFGVVEVGGIALLAPEFTQTGPDLRDAAPEGEPLFVFKLARTQHLIPAL